MYFFMRLNITSNYIVYAKPDFPIGDRNYFLIVFVILLLNNYIVYSISQN